MRRRGRHRGWWWDGTVCGEGGGGDIACGDIVGGGDDVYRNGGGGVARGCRGCGGGGGGGGDGDSSWDVGGGVHMIADVSASAAMAAAAMIFVGEVAMLAALVGVALAVFFRLRQCVKKFWFELAVFANRFWEKLDRVEESRIDNQPPVVWGCSPPACRRLVRITKMLP